jgi:Cft2 family RNA processing exonuclease
MISGLWGIVVVASQIFHVFRRLRDKLRPLQRLAQFTRLPPCGADRTVTGSCHLIEVNGRRIFLDMGMYQGPREESRRINQWLPQGAKSVDALILSHGHLDHCGKIPVLTRAGYSGPIYCTPATAEVAHIVLNDAAKSRLNRSMSPPMCRW